MEHTRANPFVPKASLIKCPNGIFEIHLHLHGCVSDVEISPFDNYLLVSGRLVPRPPTIDSQGNASALVWTDQPCGYFGRDIPLDLKKGTQFVVLEYKHICDDYIVRFTVRNANLCDDNIITRNSNSRGNPCGSCVGLAQNMYGNHVGGCRCGGAQDVRTHWGRCATGSGCGCGGTGRVHY